MVEVAVVDAGKSGSGVELDEEEDAAESDDGVEVAGVVEAVGEVADCIVVEVVAVFGVPSGVDVVDVGPIGVDEGREVLDEEDCVRSVGVAEDAVLEVESDAVEEDAASEDVAAVAGEDEGIVKSGEEEVDGDDDGWSRVGEVVASDETVDVVDEDELAVWAEEKWTIERPNTAHSSSPPTIPIRNELFFMNLLVYCSATFI